MRGLAATVGRAVLCDYPDPPPATPAARELMAGLTLVDSGTSALALAVRDAIARVNPGADAEVILPAYCCPDVLTAVHHNNARPVLVDLEPNTTWMSLDGIRNSINANTAAIIAVNFLGIRERIADIRKLLDGQECLLIDDSCQAAPLPGSTCDDVDYRVFSFGRGKPISLLHGGALQSRFGKLETGSAENSTGRPQRSRSAECRQCAMFNIARSRHIFAVLFALGLAARTSYSPPHPITPMRAFPMSVLPAALDDYFKQNSSAQSSIEAFLRSGECSPHVGAPDGMQNGATGKLLRYPLLAESAEYRDQLMSAMQKAGVCATALYGKPLADINGTDIGGSGSYPVAADFSRKLITVPLHSDISDDIVVRILQLLADKRGELC